MTKDCTRKVVLKKCSLCEKLKDTLDFNVLSSAKDGRAYACRECSKANLVAWRSKNRNRDREIKAKWAKNNSDKLKEKSKRYYSENKEAHKARCFDWAIRNPAVRAGQIARRRASKRNATPAWLTAIDLAKIQEMYDVSAALSVQTGIKHHVDHIHPLQGRGFNGLHVPWNLQIISAEQNHKKLNNIPAEDAHLLWSVAQ
jgi:hypothetical protein